MSRAGATASKLRKEIAKEERYWAKLELACRVDAVVAACESCGQEQVTSSAHVYALTQDDIDGSLYWLEPETGCMVCGHQIGCFVRRCG